MNTNHMNYVSTAKKTEGISLEEAIFLGLAPDGGLFVPEVVPQFTKKEIAELPGKTLHEIATLTLTKWLHGLFTKSEIEEIVTETFSFPIPLIEVAGYKVLELFHGPTYSFSDVSARFLSHVFKKIMKRRKMKSKILVSTSGDTGSAIAHSFATHADSKTVIVYPKGKLSRMQEHQITRVGDNVLAIEIDGDFEDCRELTNAAFADPDLQKMGIVSASSLNIARLIPQIVLYVYTYAQLYPTHATLVIPSGNFGNACTALLARLMGIPFEKIILACNTNDAAVDYANTGVFRAKRSVHTLSSAMDVGDPGNFPRILHLCGYSHKTFTEFFEAFSISDSKVINTIHAIWAEYEYMIDPHTAVAWAAADEIESSHKTMVIVATAAPTKFSEVIERHTGLKVDNTHLLTELKKREKKVISIHNDYKQFKVLLMQEFA